MAKQQSPLARRDARVAILAAAMKLIARSGARQDISVREIAAKARVNLALVSYHFGGKEGCLAELYRAKMVPSAQVRTESLRKMGAEADLEAVLATWLAPMLDLHDHEEFAERHALMTFMQTHHPSLAARLFSEVFDSTNNVFVAALLQRLPLLSRPTVIWRLHALAGATQIYRDGVYQDAMRALSNGECMANDHGEQFRQLIAFAVAGFSAPEPSPAPVRSARKVEKSRLLSAPASGRGNT